MVSVDWTSEATHWESPAERDNLSASAYRVVSALFRKVTKN